MSYNPELNKHNRMQGQMGMQGQQMMYNQQQGQMGMQGQHMGMQGQHMGMQNQQMNQGMMQQPMMNQQRNMGQHVNMMGQQMNMMGQQMNMMGQQMFMDPLMNFFQKVDTDKSGFIDAKELQAALKLTPQKLQISLECAQMLIHMFQMQRKMFNLKGTLTFMEFKSCYNYIVQLQNFYYQIDVNRDGSLNSQEMYKACQLSGYILDFQTFTKLFKAFDRSKDHQLSISEYFEICVFLASILKKFNEKSGVSKTKKKTSKITLSSKASFTFSDLVGMSTLLKYGK